MRALASRRREPTRTTRSSASAARRTRAITPPTSRVRSRGSRRTSPGQAARPTRRPTVTASDPANFANNVDRNTNIRITFSEPVNVSDAAFSLTCNGTAIAFVHTREAPPPRCSIPSAARSRSARTARISVEGDLYNDTDTNDPADTGSDFSATFTTSGLEGLRIHDIQGRQHLSPYRNSIVAGVPGVVTATRFNGFYIQDSKPDRDDRTSEGIFVFTGSPVPAAAAVGAAVTVSGRVTEFRQGCTPTCAAPDFPAGNFGSSSYPNLTLTEIDRATVTASGTGTIKPTIVGRGGREIPDTVIDDDTPDPRARRPAADHRRRRVQVERPRRHRPPGPDVRPVGGRHRLLRVARGHAHADQQGGRRRADERLQRRGRERELRAGRARRRRQGRGPALGPRRDHRPRVRPLAAAGLPQGRLQPGADHPQRPGGARQRRRRAPGGAGRRPLRQAADRRRRLRVRQLQVPRPRRAADHARQADARAGRSGRQGRPVDRVLQRREPRPGQRRRRGCRRSRARSSTTCARRTSSR